MSPSKALKLQDKIAQFLQSQPAQSHVSRKEFASLIGKLQFYAPYLRGGQACLSWCYKVQPLIVERCTELGSTPLGAEPSWGQDPGSKFSRSF